MAEPYKGEPKKDGENIFETIQKKYSSGNKFYYINFLEFITETGSVDPRKPAGMHSVAKHNSVLTNDHPFVWKYRMLMDKDIRKYNIHIHGWVEITKEEFQLGMMVHQKIMARMTGQQFSDN